MKDCVDDVTVCQPIELTDLYIDLSQQLDHWNFKIELMQIHLEKLQSEAF